MKEVISCDISSVAIFVGFAIKLLLAFASLPNFLSYHPVQLVLLEKIPHQQKMKLYERGREI